MRQRDLKRRQKKLFKKVKKVLENPDNFNPKEAELLQRQIELHEDKYGKFN